MARIKTSNKETSRKDVIIEKASHLFKEKGFNATSMREIADVVGVEAASLYNHIKSKNEILNIICFDVANRFNQKMDEVETSAETTLKKIESILRFHIDEMLNHFEQRSEEHTSELQSH